ncbi:MAG: metal dependent phosphohydrolase [Dehalococcoidia bacterium]|nr:metal dependent phosphohydrolase [Dehalococcoidia bacterium]
MEQDVRDRSEHIAQLSMSLGRALGLSAIETGNLWLAGIVHDVGEKTIPETILNKPGQLENNERQVVESHVESSVKIIEKTSFPREVLQIVSQHHERMDGSGYPGQLKGNEIVLGARILAVADVYDAMISTRPYRGAFSQEAALTYLNENKGILFDEAVVKSLYKLLKGVDLR